MWLASYEKPLPFDPLTKIGLLNGALSPPSQVRSTQDLQQKRVDHSDFGRSEVARSSDASTRERLSSLCGMRRRIRAIRMYAPCLKLGEGSRRLASSSMST